MKNLVVRLLIVLLALPAGTALAYTTSQPAANPADTAYAHSLHEEVLRENKLASELTADLLPSLPVGIVKDVGGKTIIIAIDSATFTPQGAIINAYISLELGSGQRRVAFAAKQILFQPGGASQANRWEMHLISEEKIPFGKSDLVLPANRMGNYVAFGCGGFLELSIDGYIEFDPEVIQPVIEKDREPVIEKAGEPVKTLQADLALRTTDPGNILARIDLPPFQHAKLPGVEYRARNVVADFSDIQHDPTVLFPFGYDPAMGGPIQLWKGIYIEEAQVKLPRALAGDRQNDLTLSGYNMLIDDAGFSGTVAAENFLPMGKKAMAGWPFSIDRLRISFNRDQIDGAGFGGDLRIPAFDQTDFTYDAIMQTGQSGKTEYLFLVSVTDSVEMKALGADIMLADNSVIIVKEDKGKLKPEAILHGVASVNAGDKIALTKLHFQDMHLSGEAPYIHRAIWSLEGENNKAGGFPVTVNRLAFMHDSAKIRLRADVGLHLMNDSDKGFGAETTVEVFGKITPQTVTADTSGMEVSEGEEYTPVASATAEPGQKWEYEKTTISDILINVNGGAFTMKGALSFYEKDEVYGNGFRGEVDATFKPGPHLRAIAQFGNVKDLRYWYADANARFSTPIGTGLGFYGFGGGAYYHMSRVLPNAEALEEPGQGMRVDQAMTGKVGKSLTGVIYKPDAETGMGFKAMTTIGLTGDPRLFNADAAFEMAFNRHGGVRYAALQGDAFFLTGLDERSSSAPMYANLLISYDFNNKVLHGNLDTYINFPEGVVRGIHERGLAGSAVLHFSPQDWYVHVGQPQRRIGVQILGLARTSSYFMVGTSIPGMPAPPPEVSSILGGMNLDMMRDENALGLGRGLAFGSAMQIGTGRKSLGPFYGEFSAGAGFDMMLKDYGSAYCEGRTGRIGLNGWYASGQVYAYMQGAIGIRVKTAFVNGDFQILTIGAAAVLQGKLPNPAYMRGVVGGKFSILGGLVKGNCRFKAEFGEECEIVGANEVTGIKVIASVTPKQAEGVLDVFTVPQASFNLGIGQTHQVIDDEGHVRTFRASLQRFEVSHNNTPLAGEIRWNETRDVAGFKPLEILPPNEKLDVLVSVVWEERQNGVWRPLEDGTAEEEMTSFATGDAPKNIPEENVAYSYPVKDQRNFYAEEYPAAYIKLDIGQAYLFNKEDESGNAYKFVARYEGTNTSTEVPLTYRAENQELTFEVPAALASETVYDLYILKLPLLSKALDANLNATEETIETEGGSELTIRNNELSGTLSLPEDLRLYKTQFRTSRFRTFAAKLDATGGHHTRTVMVEGFNFTRSALGMDMQELPDRAELYGSKGQEGLIQMEATTDSRWWTTFAYPDFYKPFQRTDYALEWRDPETTGGVMPLGAIGLYYQGIEEAAHAPLENRGQDGLLIMPYDVSIYTFFDQQEAVNAYMNEYVDNLEAAPASVRAFLFNPYVNLYPERYSFHMRYVLPGKDRITTDRIYGLDL
ncbi:hypothetical protein AB9P05_21360 [Roseivirga sp. BDSF3-8]|uniref:hypothetical protein n=1 Tax=Roseivirga sp. BDSF3-8 TaxID=3241598 RepID=UPI003531F98E